ncbi:MAG: aldehyde dehydrogenase family protein [Gemmatimonadaceae bacterium]
MRRRLATARHSSARFTTRCTGAELEVATTIHRETGKPVAEALAAEVAVTLDMASFVSREAPMFARAPWFTPSSLALWRKRVQIAHEPHGVIGVISPWNYPFMLPAGVVLSALATGNAVVLKPSELTPSSAALLGDLLTEAGLPPGLLSVVQGDGQTGAALATGGIDKLFFTGSVATGRRVSVACAEQFVPCVLELGGSDAAIVLDDADIEHAASGIVWGRCANAGQTCVAPKRVFVEAARAEALTRAIGDRLQRLRVGADDATYDMGPLIRPSQRDAVDAQLRDAVSRGAVLVAGAISDSGAPTALPALLTDVPHDARVWHEETFGPILPVMAVRDDADAIARANDSAFGLSASVWSRNRTRAVRVAQQLRAGTVMINDVSAVAGMADVPHGGVKASGTGRSHGLMGLEECVRTHTIIDDRFSAWRQPWWFGYAPSRLSHLDAFLRLAHGTTLRERISGIPGTLRLLRAPERPI